MSATLLMRSEQNLGRSHILLQISSVFIIQLDGPEEGPARADMVRTTWDSVLIGHEENVSFPTSFTQITFHHYMNTMVCFRIVSCLPSGLPHCPSSLPLVTQFIWLSFVLNIFSLWDSLFTSSFSYSLNSALHCLPLLFSPFFLFLVFLSPCPCCHLATSPRPALPLFFSLCPPSVSTP